MEENNETETNYSIPDVGVIKCSYDGCQQSLNYFNMSGKCELSNEKEIIYYCDAHAYDLGFCHNCGRFCGGLESFLMPDIYGGVPGLCLECFDSLSDEIESSDSEEDYDPRDYDCQEDCTNEDSSSNTEFFKPKSISLATAGSKEEDDVPF
jgi:hypothetical protein